MSAVARDAQTELEDYVSGLAEAGFGLGAITAEIERIAAMSDEEYAALPRDGSGRIVMDAAAEQPGARGYFNIRDRAAGDPQAAQRLAEWALGKVRRARERIAAVNTAAAERVSDIEAWRQEQLRTAEREDEFFIGVLDQYHADFSAGERTVKLPGGKLKLTKQRETVEWDDPAALAWALQQDNVDALAPRKLIRSAVKDGLANIGADGATTEYGEPVGFVRMVPPAQADKFTVELS